MVNLFINNKKNLHAKFDKSPCIIFVTFDFRSSTRTCIVSAFSYKIIHLNSEYNVTGKDQNQLTNALKCSQAYKFTVSANCFKPFRL